VSFTVQVNGRATNCRISRSSGVPELDGLTCRLIEQRFRFRPGTDGFGRSEDRGALRNFFEVDARYVTVAAY